ncbi:fatty acid synthase-like [Polistes fuscatus]|uniref:fatty acid synthase-like n=1 Tax=Polistes fuscatus TaxID=30207 RepID=UPI001CA83ED6|nr:fatty acid synthase-like [Polistes fuscatus]
MHPGPDGFVSGHRKDSNLFTPATKCAAMPLRLADTETYDTQLITLDYSSQYDKGRQDVLIAMETGVIPPNLLFRTSRRSPMPSGQTRKIIPDFEAADSEQSIEIVQTHLSAQSREIWYVFSRMRSQWTGIGESLMKIPISAEAIKKCDLVLRLRSYDIVHIICDKNPTIYDNIKNCFLGIAAIKILYAVNVKPNYLIGHSFCELVCSYADGCFTAEEMILSALSRGFASVESDLIHGTMATVGLGYKQFQHFCPEDIHVACHNGPDRATISGPTESIKAFEKELQSKGIFAETVLTSNIAFIVEILTMLPKNAITIEISPHGLLQTILEKSLDSDCIYLSLTKRGHKDNTTFILSTLGELYNFGFPITPGKLYQRVPYPVSKETPYISPLVRGRW